MQTSARLLLWGSICCVLVPGCVLVVGCCAAGPHHRPYVARGIYPHILYEPTRCYFKFCLVASRMLPVPRARAYHWIHTAMPWIHTAMPQMPLVLLSSSMLTTRRLAEDAGQFQRALHAI